MGDIRKFYHITKPLRLFRNHHCPFCSNTSHYSFFLFQIRHNPRGIIPTPKNALLCIIAGVIGVAGTNFIYAMAMSTGISVGIASVLSFSNYFLVMVFSRILWRVKITKQKVMAGLGAVVGIILILEIWHNIHIPINGVLLMFAVAATFAISYTLTNLSINNFHSDPDAFYFWINVIGFIILSFFSPIQGIFKEISGSFSNFGFSSIFTLIGFCLIPQAGSYIFLSRSWLYLDPPSVVIMYSLDPIVATILGFIIFHQSLDFIQILGMIIIISALILLHKFEINK